VKAQVQWCSLIAKCSFSSLDTDVHSDTRVCMVQMLDNDSLCVEENNHFAHLHTWSNQLWTVPQSERLSLKHAPTFVNIIGPRKSVRVVHFNGLTSDTGSVDMNCTSLFYVFFARRVGTVQSVYWLGYGLDDRGSFPGGERDFFSFVASRPALGPTQCALFPWGKVAGSQSDYSVPSSVEIKIVWYQGFFPWE
jgi:hypothetical protein